MSSSALPSGTIDNLVAWRSLPCHPAESNRELVSGRTLSDDVENYHRTGSWLGRACAAPMNQSLRGFKPSNPVASALLTALTETLTPR